MSERGNLPVTFLPSPPVITMASRCALGAGVRFFGPTQPASGANPFTANDLLAFPFVLTAPTPIYKAFWVTGTTTGGNAAAAIYDADYNLLVQSASTALSGSSVPQAVSMPVKLRAGMYYAAMAHDTATNNRFFRWSVSNGLVYWRMAGCWRQTSVTLATLPNPATPVAYGAISFPLFGLITRSGFDV